ncbi:hypothetical protein [Vagococcus lutrae]|uniref:hypothetical protein n=1 Tax=Vagococcus lutrae TaxID=81947 RepID=UPI00288E494F|nr:hypothetical protein [Vagococcus lutrae]MDT2808374.1 hypothetical protein [Vagococcus lutrae]
MGKSKYAAAGDMRNPINKMLNDRYMVVTFERWKELERAEIECDVYKRKKEFDFKLGFMIGVLAMLPFIL